MNKLFELLEAERPIIPDSNADYDIGYNNGLVMAQAIVLKFQCKNCQYSEPCKPYNKVWCPKMGRYMKADGFCSEGVMKDG
jgi:hypothetical protein